MNPLTEEHGGTAWGDLLAGTKVAAVLATGRGSGSKDSVHPTRFPIMRTLLAALIAMASVDTASGQAAGPLADERWRHRILLLYVPDPDGPALASFRERVHARQCGMTDRDLLIGEVIGTRAGSLDGRTLSRRQIRVLRGEHAMVAGRVATVLVGKDGGVKMIADGVADIDRVFQRIDGMPMRRQEMSERGMDSCSQRRQPHGESGLIESPHPGKST